MEHRRTSTARGTVTVLACAFATLPLLATAAHADRYVATITKAKRTGRILLDYLRNGRNNTAIVAYGARARAGAPVSMPLAWGELGPEIGPAHFTVANAPARLANTPDPWIDFRKAAAPLPGR